MIPINYNNHIFNPDEQIILFFQNGKKPIHTERIINIFLCMNNDKYNKFLIK